MREKKWLSSEDVKIPAFPSYSLSIGTTDISAGIISLGATETFYFVESQAIGSLLKELSILGLSAATVFPDLDHLAIDLVTDIESL